MRRAALMLAATSLAACAITQVRTPNPAAIPSGTLEARGATPSGPLVEVGSGVSAGVGWRLAVYPSEGDWCLQLELGGVTDTACGRLLPEEGRAFGATSHGGSVASGFVSAETATVWLIGEDGSRVPATLLSLQDAELEGQAFVGILAADTTATHVMAVKLNGDVLETHELP